jgi:spoIIIJ-associated protein
MDEFEGGRRGAHGQRRRGGRSLEKRAPAAAGAGERRPPRRAGPPREPMAPVEPSVEPEAAKPARALLEEILTKMGLDDVEIVYIARSEGEYFEVRGPRLASLIGREGKTLEALNLIYNNIINAGVRSNRRYYTIDAEGYRARRADQLKTLALTTLERVVRENKPIKLDAMLPSERKIVHLALADSPFVRTESEGVEPERRLVVFPKAASSDSSPEEA